MKNILQHLKSIQAIINISPLIVAKRSFHNLSYLLLSNKPGTNKNNLVIPTVWVYKDVNAEKALILNDNKGKTGVYR